MKGSLLLSFFLMFQGDGGRLPCQEMTSVCINTLTELAVEGRAEILVLNRAIELQKRRLWTSWITVDAANPLSMGLRLIRNLAGGGDRAATRLEISRLELRRAELQTNLRGSVSQKLSELNRAEAELTLMEEKLQSMQIRIRLLESSYAAGGESTKVMIELWQQGREVELEKRRAEQRRFSITRELENLVLGHKVWTL